jgi:hypothetical protein
VRFGGDLGYSHEFAANVNFRAAASWPCSFGWFGYRGYCELPE